ncbi:MAG: four helix bundle protein [Crocinitomicaceae bacterium]|nr:four helix bundle protein [Crocinitomicaceae bacterium]
MENDIISFVEESKVQYGKINSYKDLLVWQKSMELVKCIYALSTRLPENEKFGLTSQIRRAAVSVPSNIAEGWGMAVTGNYIHHLKISFGSLCEVETQLILIIELNFVTQEESAKVKSLIYETGKMLKSLMIALEQKIKN